MTRLVGLLFIIGLAGCGDKNPHLKTLELNRAGNKAMKANTFQIAGDKYIEALGMNPFLPELHLNLGLSFEMLQQAEKAQQSYKEAERLAKQTGNFPVLFMARFNQAQLLGKAKKVDEAIVLYQSALEIVPSSKEAKTNIELLTQSQQDKGGSDQQNKDQNQQDKDQQQQSKDSKDGKDNKDKKDQDKEGDDKDKNKQDKKYESSAKYKPRPFNGKDLSEGDVKKILGEIKQQETKIRAEFNRKEVKEQPRDKDW